MTPAFARLAVVTALAVLLQACVSAPPAPDESYTRSQPDDWSARTAQLKDFDHWTIQGKIAVRQSDRTDTGMVRNWDQSGENFSLSVSSSFMGMGTTRLEGNPGYLTITTPDGKQLFSDDPEGLIHEALGWDLPIASLAYWVRGIPAPGAEHHLYFDEDGQIGYLQQSGWQVYYENHEKLDNELPALPRRLTATHDDARVRLVVTGWDRPDQ